MPIKGTVKPESFYTGFDEEQEVDKKKGYELRVVNWGKPGKTSSFRFLSASPSVG